MGSEFTWSGVYTNLENLPQEEMPAFLSERWLNQIHTQLNEYRDASNSPPPRASDLPLIATLLGASSILDFGGSSGWTYEYIKKTSPTSANKIKKYSIYELPKVCEYFSNLSVHPIQVSYLSNLENISHHEIFYSNSMIQYMLEDDELQTCVRNSTAKMLIFENFLGGDFGDYYSEQNYYQYKIPLIFRNITKFIMQIENLGYRLIIRKTYPEPIRGVIKKFNMDNFPEHLRVEYGVTLMFTKL